MNGRARRIGTGVSFSVLLVFAAVVFLTPVHLFDDQHHVFSHHGENYRHAPDHDHHHDHEGPSHDHHWAAEHEIVAVRSNDDAPAPLLTLAVLVVLPKVDEASNVGQNRRVYDYGPPDRSAVSLHVSRAPPLL